MFIWGRAYFHYFYSLDLKYLLKYVTIDTMILYIYDLKFETRRKFNKTKRSFYYHLEKLGLTKENFLLKSTILIPDNKEQLLDDFFKDFKKKENNLVIFKVFTTHIEEL